MTKYPIFKNKMSLIASGLFVVLTIWWLTLSPFQTTDLDTLTHKRYIWGSTYQVIALWGAICGFVISKFWGGTKSVMGRSVIAFSVGLLLQVLGQSFYSYYNLFAQIEAPYPSFGDVGYFGSIFAYIYGVSLLARASGVKVSLKSYSNQAKAVMIPLLLLLFSYSFFLINYEYDFGNKLKIFLDFGYPLGQAFYVSLAILTFLLSKKFLGGMMKGPILFLLIALIVQYFSDFNFLYQASQETWYVGGIGDFLYMLSYFVMALSLIHIGNVFKTIQTKT
jgi:hypothetical protein